MTDDIWKPVRLGLLFFAIGVAPLLVAIAVILFVLPSLGINVNYSVNPRTQPLSLLVFVVGVLTLLLSTLASGAAIAAKVAIRYFNREDVKAEFLSFMWLPKTSALSSKLFDRMFPVSKIS